MQPFKYLLFIYLIGQIFSLNASHIKGGEFALNRISTYKYDIGLILYLDPNGASQPEATLDFGDGTSATVSITSNISIGKNINRCVYLFHKTFPGTGTYKISFTTNYRI